MTIPPLRQYQDDCNDGIVCAHDAGQNRLLVKMPTGTGKTEVFASFLTWPRLRAWLEQFPATSRQMLVVAHREELLDQAAARIQRRNPGIMVSIEQGDRHANSYSDVIVASIQSLSAMKFRRLKRLLAKRTPRIVIIDEAHHAAAATYRTMLVHLGFLPPADASDSGELEAVTHDDVKAMTAALDGWDLIAPKDRLLIGMTATPNRSDAIGLGCVFQTIAYSYNLKTAIRDGWLVPIAPWVVETDTSLEAVRITHGDFNQRDLANAVNNARRNQLALAAWEEHAADLSTIAFTVDVAHAHSLADLFAKAGHAFVPLSGETPKEDRRQILRAYTEGTITGITNCMVLTEGTDLPRTGCILHAKPTKSATLYEQMTGRGLRIHPQKTECVVIDVVDIARRHSLQSAPVLYGLPPGINTKGETLDDLEAKLEAVREAVPNFDLETALAQGRLSLAELQARASLIDVWTVPTLGAFGTGRALDWIKAGEELYRLQYPWADGTEVLQISRDMLGHYEVTKTLRPRDGGPARQATLAAQIGTADEAAGFAEAFVLSDRRSVMKIRGTDAPWRNKPASRNQVALLERLRAPFNAATITMGEASNMISLWQARKDAGRIAK